jgi:hypothetical protein
VTRTYRQHALYSPQGMQHGFVALLLVGYAPLVTPLARKADKAALIDLFKLLGGPHWTNNDGWDPDGGADPCEVEQRWYGVGCAMLVRRRRARGSVLRTPTQPPAVSLPPSPSLSPAAQVH